MQLYTSLIYCSLLLSIVACTSINKSAGRFSWEKVKEPAIAAIDNKIIFNVKSLNVFPVERNVRGTFLRPITGVKYINSLDLYVYGGDIEYDVKFEITFDSNEQTNNYIYQLGKINILTNPSPKMANENSLVIDSIFILPTFKAIQSKGERQQTLAGKVRLSHFSSSRKTNVAFQLKDKEIIIKTKFAKPMVPGG